MADLPVLKIFLSSPGDVSEERALAEIVFRRLSDRLSEVVQLKLVIWEHEPLFAHADFMSQMPRPSQCDLVVTILWSRLGTRLPSDWSEDPNFPPPTGTEWEVRDALKSYEAMGKPNLLIYRKIPGPQVGLGSADFEERNRQWQMLDDFCRHAFFDASGAITVAHHAFADGHDFERMLSDHVRAWLERQVEGASEQVVASWRGKSPFRGLEPFDAEHRAVFFGRSEALSNLIERIRGAESAAKAGQPARFLIVQGMSGAGKTSLFKAGLLPFLEMRPIEGIANWKVINLRPSESDPQIRELGPLGVLALRLTEAVPSLTRLGTTAEKLAELLRDKPDEALGRLETCLAAEAEERSSTLARSRTFIYVDQLEEAFLATEVDSTRFLRSLVTLARSDAIWVGATLRSDFAHRLERHPELMACLAQTPPYTLLPPHPGEFAEIIQGPAHAAALVWEQRDGISLDQALIRDAAANPEALPLLEYTLEQLYAKRDGRLLRWSTYAGGLQEALISAADESLQGTGNEQSAAFREVMRELVGVGADGVATRRYASLSRFPAGTPARALLDRLVERRLCVTDDEGRGDGPVTRLAHEALIRAWPAAQDWLKQETLLLQIRDEVTRDADVWNRHGQKDDWLGVAPEKITAINQIERAGLLPGGVAPVYAQRSKNRAARNSRLRRTAFAAITGLAVAAGAAWWLALNQRNAARQQAETADRATAFMVSLFKLADPTETQGASVTAEQILKKGAADITTSGHTGGLDKEPAVRATLLTAMGEAYSGLGLYKDATGLFSRALTDEKTASVPEDTKVRTLLGAGTALYLAGGYEEAERPLREALGQVKAESLVGSLSSEVSTGLADDLVQLGRFDEAVALCLEAVAADRKRVPPDSATLANSLASLGSAYFYSHNLPAAEGSLREALALRTKVFGEQDARTAESVNLLGSVLYESGKYDEAMREFQKALPMDRHIYGDNHPTVATDLNNIGRAGLMAGDVDAAEPVLRQALAMMRAFEGDDHDYLVSPLNSLAMIDAYHGDLERAKAEIDRAMSIARLPDHGELLDQVLLNAADLAIAEGNASNAGRLLSEAKSALQKAHPATTENLWRYAVWDSVNARLIGVEGDRFSAERLIATAEGALSARFGAKGFYVVRAERTRQELMTTPRAK